MAAEVSQKISRRPTTDIADVMKPVVKKSSYTQ